METTIDVTTARRQLGTLLDKVYYKKERVIIERKGKPLAKIVPFEETDIENRQLSSQQKELLEELHSLPAISTNENPTRILRNNRKQKRIICNVFNKWS